MEFTIARSEMLAGLYLTQGIVERRTTIPILGNVLVRSTEGGIAIEATDQEVSVSRRCTATVKKKGTLTTGARKLYEMIRELPDTEIRIRSVDNNWIEVVADRSRFRLVGLDPREFPAIPQPQPETQAQTLRIPGKTLVEMIEHTLFAVSADESRMNLNGIYLEAAEGGRVRFVATDGHRLAMICRSAEGRGFDQGIIIPRKAVLELRKVLESGEEDIELTVDGGVLHAQRGPVQMSMRLVEGEFPDYTQVVPSASTRVATLGVGNFLAALRRVSIVSSERTRGVKLQVEAAKIELSSINPDIGEAAEELEVEYEAEQLVIGFNARYIMDALAVMPADGKVELGFTDDVSPGVIRQADDPDYCYIVMPMRL